MRDDQTENDVLEPFVLEWAERARKAQEAIDALTSGAQASRAPRIERRGKAGKQRYVLVRRDGDESRILFGLEAHEVTVRFSPDEWSMITRVVLLQHGLSTVHPSPTTPDDFGTKQKVIQ